MSRTSWTGYKDDPCFEVVADSMILESVERTKAENDSVLPAIERYPELAKSFANLEDLIVVAFEHHNLKRLHRALGIREGLTRTAHDLMQLPPRPADRVKHE